MSAKLMRAILGALMWISCCVAAYSQTTVADGVTYRLNTDGSWSVTLGDTFYNGTLDVPATVQGAAVRGIDYAGANSCHSLKKVQLAEGCTTLDHYAFNGCDSLTTVTLPASITTIGNYAFSRCLALTALNLPERLTEVGDGAFLSCKKLTSLSLGADVTRIGHRAFDGCRLLKTITVSDGNTAFCDIDGVLFNKDATRLVAFPRKNTSWRDYILPATVTVIDAYAFNGCDAMKTIALPDGLETIGEWAFGGCKLIREIHLPASVGAIGANAFNGCHAQLELHLAHTTPPVLDERRDPFGFLPSKAAMKLYVPAGTLQLYTEAPVWRDFGTIVEDASKINETRHINDIRVTVDGRIITVTGLSAGTTVILYDIAGAQLTSITAASSTVTIPTPSTGSYIITANGKAIKVAVK